MACIVLPVPAHPGIYGTNANSLLAPLFRLCLVALSMPVTEDTIVALASAPGAATRGIVRISGVNTLQVLLKCFRSQAERDFTTARVPRRYPGEMQLQGVRTALPASLCWWPTQRSYTGEPLAEIHTLGSPPLLDAVVATLCEQGARPARPGEFTLRAFLSGRIDLVQAEAVLGVIDAADHVELQTALSQLAGGISHRLSALRTDLLELLADLEAGLDFVDEHIEFVSHADVLARVTAAGEMIGGLLKMSVDRMQTTGRQRVVLAGLPNAGKSSLFNALVGSDTALVSPQAGTTRDYLSAHVDWNGLPIELIDTAGWDATPLGIEHAADEFRQQQVDAADLVLHCSARDLAVAEHTIDTRLQESLQSAGRPWLSVLTKVDLPGSHHPSPGPKTAIPVSIRDADSLNELRSAVVARLSTVDATRNDRQFVGTTAARCRESLRLTRDALQAARETALQNTGDELLAMDLREALGYLGSILGSVYTDDILDRVFSKFCIGK